MTASRKNLNRHLTESRRWLQRHERLLEPAQLHELLSQAPAALVTPDGRWIRIFGGLGGLVILAIIVWLASPLGNDWMQGFAPYGTVAPCNVRQELLPAADTADGRERPEAEDRRDKVLGTITEESEAAHGDVPPSGAQTRISSAMPADLPRASHNSGRRDGQSLSHSASLTLRYARGELAVAEMQLMEFELQDSHALRRKLIRTALQQADVAALEARGIPLIELRPEALPSLGMRAVADALQIFERMDGGGLLRHSFDRRGSKHELEGRTPEIGPTVFRYIRLITDGNGRRRYSRQPRYSNASSAASPPGAGDSLFIFIPNRIDPERSLVWEATDYASLSSSIPRQASPQEVERYLASESSIDSAQAPPVSSLVPLIYRGALAAGDRAAPEPPVHVFDRDLILWFDRDAAFIDLLPTALLHELLMAIQTERERSLALTRLDSAGLMDASVFPNPSFDGRITVRCLTTGRCDLEVQLYSLRGEFLEDLAPSGPREAGIWEVSGRLGHLDAGLFVLAVRSSHGELFQRRIVLEH